MELCIGALSAISLAICIAAPSAISLPCHWRTGLAPCAISLACHWRSVLRPSAISLACHWHSVLAPSAISRACQGRSVLAPSAIRLACQRRSVSTPRSPDERHGETPTSKRQGMSHNRNKSNSTADAARVEGRGKSDGFIRCLWAFFTGKFLTTNCLTLKLNGKVTEYNIRCNVIVTHFSL